MDWLNTGLHCCWRCEYFRATCGWRHSKLLLYLGSFLVVLGMIMTSTSSKFYQLVLCPGGCVGLGWSMVSCSLPSLVQSYVFGRQSWSTEYYYSSYFLFMYSYIFLGLPFLTKVELSHSHYYLDFFQEHLSRFLRHVLRP